MSETLTYDEQIQKLIDICEEKYKVFKFYDDEIEVEIEEGFDIHPDLIEKMELANKEFQEAVFNKDIFISFCSINNIDLPKYWEKLGFTKPYNF